MTLPQKPSVNLRYLYVMCNDIPAMKTFYGDLLGMSVQAFMNEAQFGYLAFQGDGMQLMFFRADAKLPVVAEFAGQPGYQGGKLEATSWSIQIPEADFAAAVERLHKAGAKRFAEKPFWAQDSYWSFPVLDPMGNTVEVFATPKEKPAKKEWPGR